MTGQSSEKQKGEIYILSATLLGAFFPIVAVLSFSSVPPLLSLGWSTAISTLFFAVMMAYKRKWHELKDPLVWKYSLFVVLFIGVLLYGLFFLGLEKTTPGNAAIINLFAVFTSFLFFNVWRREPISFEYKCGAALMLLGALIVLAPGFSSINIGDFLIFIAMFCAPPGNLYQRKAREIASSETVMFLRSLLSVPFIFLLALMLQEHASLTDVQAALPYLLLNGVLILGLSKIFWIEAIHRMLVTKAEAFNTVTPFLTLLFAYVLLHQAPTLWQLAALLPIVLGVLLLTDQIGFRATSQKSRSL